MDGVAIRENVLGLDHSGNNAVLPAKRAFAVVFCVSMDYRHPITWIYGVAIYGIRNRPVNSDIRVRVSANSVHDGKSALVQIRQTCPVVTGPLWGIDIIGVSELAI